MVLMKFWALLLLCLTNCLAQQIIPHARIQQLEAGGTVLPSQLNAFGNSWTAGYGITTASNVYWQQVARAKGLTATGYGILGATVPDLANEVYSATITTDTRSILEEVTNSSRIFGGNVNELAYYRAGLSSLAAFLALPSGNKTLPSQMSCSGTWTTHVGWPGKASNSVGASCSFTTYGNIAFVGTIYQHDNRGAMKINVDGVDYGSYSNITPGNESLPTYINGYDFGPRLIVLTGLGDNPHTVTLQVTDGTGYSYIDWGGYPARIGNTSVNPGPFVYLGDEGVLGTLGYTSSCSTCTRGNSAVTTLYNSTVSGVASELSSYGLQIVYVPVSKAVTVTDMQSDQTHPTDAGHGKIANAYRDAMNELVLPGDRQAMKSLSARLFGAADYTVHLTGNGSPFNIDLASQSYYASYGFSVAGTPVSVWSWLGSSDGITGRAGRIELNTLGNYDFSFRRNDDDLFTLTTNGANLLADDNTHIRSLEWIEASTGVAAVTWLGTAAGVSGRSGRMEIGTIAAADIAMRRGDADAAIFSGTGLTLFSPNNTASRSFALTEGTTSMGSLSYIGVSAGLGSRNGTLELNSAGDHDITLLRYGSEQARLFTNGFRLKSPNSTSYRIFTVSEGGTDMASFGWIGSGAGVGGGRDGTVEINSNGAQDVTVMRDGVQMIRVTGDSLIVQSPSSSFYRNVSFSEDGSVMAAMTWLGSVSGVSGRTNRFELGTIGSQSVAFRVNSTDALVLNPSLAVWSLPIYAGVGLTIPSGQHLYGLAATDVPNLDASIITTGAFGLALLPSLTVTAGTGLSGGGNVAASGSVTLSVSLAGGSKSCSTGQHIASISIDSAGALTATCN